MSKTDTVARFSLIFARKFHCSENSSVRQNFCQKLAEAFPLLKITTPSGVLGRGSALASAELAHGVHAHGVQPCSEPQCSVAALLSSTRVCARARATGVRSGTATSCRQNPALQAASWPWPPEQPCRKGVCAADPPGMTGR